MKSALVRTLALAVTFSALPPAVQANPSTGSRIDRTPGGLTKRFDPRHAKSPRPALNVYFRCMASLNRAQADKVLELPFRSEEQLAMVEEVIPSSQFAIDRRQDCFSDFGDVEIRYDAATAIGGFAEFLTIANFGKDDVTRIPALTHADWKFKGLLPRNGSEMIGLCVAQARGDLVFELIQSEPASATEGEVIRKIVPLLGPCLTRGVEVSFDVTSLRSLLAYGLYRTVSQMAELRRAS